MSQLPPVAVDVSYTVKELFEKVDTKLDAISAKLDGKADKAHVDQLEAEVEHLKGEVSDLKLWKAKVWGFAAAIGALVGGGTASLTQLFQ